MIITRIVTRVLTRLYKIMKRLFGRAFFLIVSALFQILWFTLFITLLGIRYPIFAGVVRGFCLLIVLYLVNKRVNPAYKLAWSLVILAAPLIGFSLYLIFGRSRFRRQTREHMEVIERMSYDVLEHTVPRDHPNELTEELRVELREELHESAESVSEKAEDVSGSEAVRVPVETDAVVMTQDREVPAENLPVGNSEPAAEGSLAQGDKPSELLETQLIDSGELPVRNLTVDGREPVLDILHRENENMARQAEYLSKVAHYPVYRNTETKYYPDGESLFIDMVDALKEAKHFIFMEYFIIDNGEMWGTVLDILEQKASEGLDVRMIYDDVGCVNTLPARFYKQLQERGIKCQVFNPFRPFISIVLNNRDHRKIMVVDGHTGFTGGINLADEYINKKMRFGHWKDTGVRICGEAVWNFTIMFLQMWCSITGETRDLQGDSAKAFSPNRYWDGPPGDDGYVQPYGDSPLDEETVGENVYLQMIANARRYIYIFTPYLIIDNEMMTALCLAAKSGLDVRIVTPGIPDKRFVFLLTRSYYAQLLDAGVRIFEYNPGFIHAKCFVCDDEVAAVGTINLDYRSLYLHFECSVWMYKSRAVMEVKEDVLETLDVSTEMTVSEVKGWKLPVRMLQSLLRLLAPML